MIQDAKNIVFRKLRDVVIFDYTTSLRPFGGQIRDLAFMFLNTDVFHILNKGFLG